MSANNTYDPMQHYGGMDPQVPEGQGRVEPHDIVGFRRLLSQAHPIGSIYIETTGTNPANTFGFGAWQSFGAGRVLVGLDPNDVDFDTVLETGGGKTVASNVTVATQPAFSVNSHTHPLSANGQAQITVAASSPAVIARRVATSTWTATHADGSSGAGNSTSQSTGAALAGSTDGATASTTRTADVALTNNATSVVQPYIVVYMWLRTA